MTDQQMYLLRIRILTVFVCLSCCLATVAQEIMYVDMQETGTDKNKAERFSAGFALVAIKGRSHAQAGNKGLEKGKPITVEGMKDTEFFEINQSLW